MHKNKLFFFSEQSARAIDGLSAGQEYTFKLVAVKHGERSAEVMVGSNTSKLLWNKNSHIFKINYL